MALNVNEVDVLINRLISENYTMVTRERFDMIYRHANTINNLDGDIVECGVWKGGMSIFLSNLFDTKRIWVVDSFAGFQNHITAKYYYEDEAHKLGEHAVSLENVKENFQIFNSLNERINFLKGYVVDTLHPSVCSINKIALLRIDVDAYSATMEVLEYLYDKVVPGGYIIFDDSGLSQTANAIRDHFTRENILLELYRADDDAITSLDETKHGHFYIKPI